MPSSAPCHRKVGPRKRRPSRGSDASASTSSSLKIYPTIRCLQHAYRPAQSDSFGNVTPALAVQDRYHRLLIPLDRRISGTVGIPCSWTTAHGRLDFEQSACGLMLSVAAIVFCLLGGWDMWWGCAMGKVWQSGKTMGRGRGCHE